MTPITDTAPEAEQVWIETHRRLTPDQKWQILGEAFVSAALLRAAGQRLRDQFDSSGRQLNNATSTPSVAQETKPVVDQAPANLEILREVVAVFDRLNIAYALGGSMASSLHGIARFTQDADVTVAPFPGNEPAFALALGPEYYLSLPAIQDAVRDRTWFNIIHTQRGFKVDVFVQKDNAFEQTALARRQPIELTDVPGHPLFVHSAEDVVLFKLVWYRLGNETSSQQWHDIIGVMRVQGARLARAYLAHWSSQLQVAELYARAARETGIGV